MAIETWGQLPKSQIDPQKIEEAIAEIIAEHNDNEEAHVGEGQSLSQHKLSEIIDHLVGSIPTDKISNTQHVIRSNFFEASGYSLKPDGLVVKPYYCSFSILSAGITKLLETGVAPFDPARITEKNLLWGVGFSLSWTTNSLHEFHLYNEDEDEKEYYIGFESRTGVLWGVARSGDTLSEIPLLNLDPVAWHHMVRLVCDSEKGKVYFYYNKEKVGELEIPEFVETTDLNLRFRVTSNAPGAYSALTLRSLLLSADV